MSGFGAFLDGLVQGAQRRRNWMLEDEEMSWAREDRERRHAAEDADREWTEYSRNREREGHSREDELREREREILGRILEPGGAGPTNDEPATPNTPTVQPEAEPPPLPSVHDPSDRREVAAEYGASQQGGSDSGDPRRGMFATGSTRPTGNGRRLTADTAPARASQPQAMPVPGSAPSAPQPSRASAPPARSYVDTVRSAGIEDPRIVNAAERADAAAALLAEGVNPRTGAALDGAGRQQAEVVVREFERVLADVAARGGTERRVPGPEGQGRPPGEEQGPPQRPQPVVGRTLTPRPDTMPRGVDMRTVPQAGLPQQPNPPATGGVRQPVTPSLEAAAPDGPYANPATIAERTAAAAPGPATNNGPIQSAIAMGPQNARSLVPPTAPQAPRAAPGMPAPPQAPGAAPTPDAAPPQSITERSQGRRVAPDAPAPTLADVAQPDNPAAAEQATQAAAQASRETPSAQVGQQVVDEALQGRTLQASPDGRNIEYLDEATIEQVGQRFQTTYNNDAIRELEAFYIANGDVERARAWREFAQEETTQQAVYHFGRALAAARVGDAERFLGEMAAIYNSPQYYEDGYTLDLARSQIFRGDDGSFQGVSLALVNDDTGEVSMQELVDEDDLYTLGLGLAAPETVFSRWFDEYESVIATREAAAAAWQAANAQPTMAERREDFDAVFEEMMDASTSESLGPPVEGQPPRFHELSPAEQARLVIEYLETREGALTGRTITAPPAGDVPVAVAP